MWWWLVASVLAGAGADGGKAAPAAGGAGGASSQAGSPQAASPQAGSQEGAHPKGPEMIPESSMDPVGQVASDFAIPLKDGGTFKLSEQKGKVVVISFWASWCTPCRNELPALAKLAEDRKDLVFIAVNVDRLRADADKFLAAVPFALPIGFDSEAIALGGYGVVSMPTMFVVDRKGVTRFKKTGYSTEKGFTELLAALETI